MPAWNPVCVHVPFESVWTGAGSGPEPETVANVMVTFAKPPLPVETLPETANSSGGWLTVKIWPATVMVPVRVAVELLGATEYIMLPFPEPLIWEMMLIQLALLADIHVQPAGAVTDTVPLPPPAGMVWLVGEIEYEHAAPAWVTVKTCPAAVMVPERDVVLLFAATE